MPIKESVNKQTELLKKSEISLWINHYDYIFSDFDHRPYSERSLSDDFISEAKRAARDKASGQIELKFLVPKNIREVFTEKTIKSRLKDHFKKHTAEKLKEYKKVIFQGLSFILMGIIFMALTTFILIRQAYSSSLITFLSVLFEPAGWFLFWEGLNLMIFETKRKSPDLEFYEKMSEADINFSDY